MKNSTHLRNIVLLISVVALFLTMGLYAYLYNGTLNLVDKVIGGRKILSASEAMLLQEKDIMDLSDRTAPSRARLTTFFVPAQNAVSFLKVIESIGVSSGATVSISAIKSTPPSADGESNVGEVSATVNVSGSWTEVMRALELFESIPYLNDIGHMTLSTSEQKWQMAFDISAPSIQ